MVLRRTPVRLTRLRSLLIITVLIGTGCGSNADYDDDDDDTAAGQTADPAVATTDTPSGAQATIAQDTDVPEALRFRAPLVGGGEIDMSTLAGMPGRVVVLGPVLKHVQPRSPLGRGGSATMGGPGGVRGRGVDGL